MELADARTAVRLLPAWGGKLASLVDRRRSREWLFAHPAMPWRQPAPTAQNFGDYDVGGFDECFPNIAAGAYPQAPFAGRALPDHGEVWARTWHCEPTGAGVRLTITGEALPYRLTKTIALLPEGGIRCDYRLENLAPEAWRFVWSSHPAFAVKPGMRLERAAGPGRIDCAVGTLTADAGQAFTWPHLPQLDLTQTPPATAGWAAKLYLANNASTLLRMVDPADGATCELRADPAAVPQLGLWLNYSGWTGNPQLPPVYTVAAEPCIGDTDNLAQAIARGSAGTLPAAGAVEWWLELRLS